METKRLVVPAAEEVLGLYFRCLDHGFVGLVDYMGGDDSVVRSARVSYGAGTKTALEDEGLIRYMLGHKHTSPFEQVMLTFHVKLPIFVARQLIRHRTASLNEYSMRYSLPVMQFYMPKPENLGTQSKKNKQGRAEPVNLDQAAYILGKWKELQLNSVEFYNYLVSAEVDLARELARIGLPVQIYTEWYWSMDLHNLLHFLTLRCDGHAQWEIQQYANIKAGITNRLAPMSFRAWLDYNFQSRRFSRMEMCILRELLYVEKDGTFEISAEGNLKDRALALGMSKREWDDFASCLNAEESPNRYEELLNYRVDPADGLAPEVFLEEAQRYITKQV